ncbi:MAG TPA: hypothetical protein PKG95_03530 [Anaerolineaceae bacterium]|nr:hypothetical protein [Anaerolineaceae bacterium]
METPKLPPFLPVLLTSLLLIITGVGGLVAIFYYTLPLLGPRWLFFFLITIAFSGLMLPVTHFLNLRFPSVPPADAGVVVRQAIWFGVMASLLTWLQLGRVLNVPVIIFIALALGAIEFLLRMRERSRWTPPETAPDASAGEAAGRSVGGSSAESFDGSLDGSADGSPDE